MFFIFRDILPLLLLIYLCTSVEVKSPEDMKDYEEDAKRLKEWYSRQPHLPQNISEHYFYTFVSGTKSLEKAKQKIDAFFTLRADTYHLCRGVFLSTQIFKNYTLANYMVVLPEKTPDGHRVLIVRTSNSSMSKFLNSNAYFYRLLITIELAFYLWPTDTNVIAFHDYYGVDIGLTKTLDLKIVHGFMKMLTKGFPIRNHKTCLINAPGYVEKAVNLMRPFLSEKINRRINVYHDDTPIKEILPLSMVPLEYGGQGKSLKEIGAKWVELVESHQDWLEDMLKLCPDESKRPKDSFARETLDFGLEGSFKSLSFD